MKIKKANTSFKIVCNSCSVGVRFITKRAVSIIKRNKVKGIHAVI